LKKGFWLWVFEVYVWLLPSTSDLLSPFKEWARGMKDRRREICKATRLGVVSLSFFSVEKAGKPGPGERGEKNDKKGTKGGTVTEKSYRKNVGVLKSERKNSWPMGRVHQRRWEEGRKHTRKPARVSIPCTPLEKFAILNLRKHRRGVTGKEGD